MSTPLETRPSRRPASEVRQPGVLPRVAGYELVRLLGRGGMASVYLARQLKLNRLVALKELSPPFAGDPEFIGRFLRESHLVGGLSHPNVVTVYDYFEDEGMPYIAMEHVARGSLRPFVTGRSFAEVVGILEGILAGLGHAHAAGVVHCDVKPENVLVTATGDVKLGDFGIARAADVAAASWQGAGRPTGTLAYMAPEMVTRQTVDHRADLWSVGVMAYELLAGALPATSSPRLSRTARAVDPRITAWVDALLETSPNRRPQSADDACERLEEIALACLGPRWRRAARLGGNGAASVALGGPERAHPSGRRLLMAGALGAVGTAVAVLVLAYAPGADPGRSELHDAALVSAPAAPVRLTAPRVVRAQSTGGAMRVRFRARATRSGRVIAVRCQPASGTLFSIGTTRVRCVAEDTRRSIRVVVKAPSAAVAPAPGPAAQGSSDTSSSPAPADEPQGISTS